MQYIPIHRSFIYVIVIIPSVFLVLTELIWYPLNGFNADELRALLFPYMYAWLNWSENCPDEYFVCLMWYGNLRCPWTNRKICFVRYTRIAYKIEEGARFGRIITFQESVSLKFLAACFRWTMKKLLILNRIVRFGVSIILLFSSTTVIY